jgi:preprotein translocase subunit SecY
MKSIELAEQKRKKGPYIPGLKRRGFTARMVKRAYRPSLTMLASVKSFFLSFHSFFLLSLHTSPFTPASGLVRFL